MSQLTSILDSIFKTNGGPTRQWRNANEILLTHTEEAKKYVSYMKNKIRDLNKNTQLLALDFLDYRLRLFGSSGGHNGLKDIERCLGSNHFRRFRIGISNNKNIDTKDYVLGKFSKNDTNSINEFLPKTVDILNDFIKIDFEKVMSKYN